MITKTVFPSPCFLHSYFIRLIHVSGSIIDFLAVNAPFAPPNGIAFEDLNGTEMAGGAALDQDVKLAAAHGVPFENIFAHD